MLKRGKVLLLVLASFLAFSSFVLFIVPAAFAQVQLTDCGLLDQPNTEYVLQNDVSVDGTCFVIKGGNIILNLNTHTLTFYNPSPLDYSFGIVCHPSYSPPGRPAIWMGGGDNLKIMNGKIVQASSDTKHAEMSTGLMSHAIYARSCNNIELADLEITANSQYDATIIRLRGVNGGYVHDLKINNNVQNLTNRHWPGQRSLLIEDGSGGYEIENVEINGGPHVGISLEGVFDSCDVHDNTIRHNERYVNGYAIAASGSNLDIHHNTIIPVVGRGVHITGDNILFHHNYIELKESQVIDHYDDYDYHNIFTNVHGIKFEGGINSKVYSNTVIARQPGPEYAPPTPLNIDTPDSNANNEIYGNNFTAITYAATSGGTAGYGEFDTYAAGIVFLSCSGSNPGSIHDNNFYSNDRAVFFTGQACSNYKVYNNVFEKLSSSTSNGHTIMYNNYDAASKSTNFSGNWFVGFEPDDIWFRSQSYSQLSLAMMFRLGITVLDESQAPAVNPSVIIKDKDGNIAFQGSGNTNGKLEISFPMYLMDRSWDPDIKYYSPYSIECGENDIEFTLEQNLNITISADCTSVCSGCGQNQSVKCTDADTNSDNSISNPEMREYLGKFLRGEAGISSVMDTIKEWKQGCA
jgi:hypothetical protein